MYQGSGHGDITLPVCGELKFGDVGLEEGSVAMVTVFLSVFLNEVFHEVNSRHMVSAG